MKTLGPFLVQSNAANAPLFWYQFSLGGYQDQSLWSILRMPFREDAGLPVLQAFKTYDPEPCVLHAFDPAYGSYFSLVVTTEHKILRFRPTGLTHPQKVLFNTEQYTGQGFTPTRTDFDITQYHYQVTAEALGANENKLKLICQSQYQATQPPPPLG